MRDDVAMVDKCKHGTQMSNKHVNKDFEINAFHKFESVNLEYRIVIMYVQEVLWSIHFQPIK